MSAASLDPVPASFDLALGDARLAWDGVQLALRSGSFRRVWTAVAGGLATRRIEAGDRCLGASQSDEPDWLIRWFTDRGVVRLLGLAVREVGDDPGTAPHLCLRAEWLLEATGFRLGWELRAYPGVAGCWTRLDLLPPRAFRREDRDLPSWLGWSFGERLPLGCVGARVRAAGYHADTQHRNFDHSPLLVEEEWPEWRCGRHGRPIEWANLVTVEQDGAAITVVKENHKCVDQQGIDTGAFVLGPEALVVTGLGLMGNDYGQRHWAGAERRLHCWATWTLVHDAGRAAATRAVKHFDRTRFLLRPKRDCHIVTNTWGSGGSWFPLPDDEGSPAATGEAALLRELDSCADLGVDALQIDHGWHCAPCDRSPERDRSENPWRPHPERLPGGWAVVRAAAERLGVTLGLWFPWHVSDEKILWNVREGGFTRLKLDFMGLRDRQTVEDLHDKLARLRAGGGADLGIDWDVTEHGPRVGYFTLRDFGNLHLENRENGPGPMTAHNHIRYVPRLVLRDIWQLAQYLPIDRIQVPVQNIDEVREDYSDCRAYGHAYAFAIAFFAQPLLFQQTQRLSPAARDALRPLIALHRAHRAHFHGRLVEALGGEPDGASWTGFQAHSDAQSGYLTLFRELEAEHPVGQLTLHSLPLGSELEIEDLRQGTTQTHRLDGDVLHWQLDRPADFALLRYRVLG